MHVSTAAELLSFMVASYNDGIPEEDWLKESEALEYFHLPQAELEKVNGTGPWTKESYGYVDGEPTGDPLSPDWVALGHPELADDDTPLPSRCVVVHDDLLIVAVAVPGQVGLEWACWCLVK
jgi:hypothetical protein